MNQYQSESTPDLEDLQQEPEPDAFITVPVRVESIGTVQTHVIPARDASMRSVAVDSTVQQIVGANLRRQRIRVWATAATASNFVYIGTDKNQVESNTAARLPAVVDTYADGAPVILDMSHAKEIWVKCPPDVTAVLSIVTEDWAD